MEKEALNQDEMAARAIKPRCPWCALVLYVGVVDDVPALICPDTEGCGYSAPI